MFLLAANAAITYNYMPNKLPRRTAVCIIEHRELVATKHKTCTGQVTALQ